MVLIDVYQLAMERLSNKCPLLTDTQREELRNSFSSFVNPHTNEPLTTKVVNRIIRDWGYEEEDEFPTLPSKILTALERIDCSLLTGTVDSFFSLLLHYAYDVEFHTIVEGASQQFSYNPNRKLELRIEEWKKEFNTSSIQLKGTPVEVCFNYACVNSKRTDFDVLLNYNPTKVAGRNTPRYDKRTRHINDAWGIEVIETFICATVHNSRTGGEIVKSSIYNCGLTTNGKTTTSGWQDSPARTVQIETLTLFRIKAGDEVVYFIEVTALASAKFSCDNEVSYKSTAAEEWCNKIGLVTLEEKPIYMKQHGTNGSKFDNSSMLYCGSTQYH